MRQVRGCLFLFLTAVLCLAFPGQAQEGSQAKPRGTLADLSWLVGHWQGRFVGPRGLLLEQHWAAPQGGVMVGMFSLRDPADGNKALLLEFISLRETPEGVEMRLRHFDTALAPMEKEEPIRLTLRESDGARFVFENPVNNVPKRSIITRVGENGYTGRTEIIRDTGEQVLHQTTWERVGCAPVESPALPSSREKH